MIILGENFKQFLENHKLGGGETLLQMENKKNLEIILDHWADYHNVEISSDFLHEKINSFLNETYHDTDTYLLYSFMLLKFMEYLLEFDGPWKKDVGDALTYLSLAVKTDSKQEAVLCMKHVLGDDFPE